MLFREPHPHPPDPVILNAPILWYVIWGVSDIRGWGECHIRGRGLVLKLNLRVRLEATGLPGALKISTLNLQH